MIKNVTSVLMDNYGYESCGFITYPLMDKYDVMLASGPVSILLTDDINSEIITMRIIENAQESKTYIHYGCKDYADVILGALLEFAIRRLPLTPPKFITD